MFWHPESGSSSPVFPSERSILPPIRSHGRHVFTDDGAHGNGCWPSVRCRSLPDHPCRNSSAARTGSRASGRSLTRRAGQCGESERLAAAGHHGAHSALSAARAVLFERAKSPKYWPFPSKRGNGLSTGSAEELVVEGFGSSGRIRTYNPSVNSRTAYGRLALQTRDLGARKSNFPGILGDFGGTVQGRRNRVVAAPGFLVRRHVPPSAVRGDSSLPSRLRRISHGQTAGGASRPGSSL